MKNYNSEYRARAEQMHHFAVDETPTPKEKLSYIYHATMFELHLIRRDREIRRAEKHAVVLRKLVKIVNFRKDLANL